MSAIRFSIIDYTSGSPVTTIIDEPVGLDKVALTMERNSDYHGFDDLVDLGALQFWGEGLSILKTAKDDFGVDAHVECLIEFQCDDDDAFQTLYKGRFSIDTMKIVEGINGCYAEAIIENDYEFTIFRNRYDQKVSLDSRQTFDELQDDGVTPYPTLPAYDALGRNIELEPMLIRQVDYGTVDTHVIGSTVYAVDDNYNAGTQPNPLPGPGDHVMFYDNSNPPPASSYVDNEFNLTSPNTVLVPFTNVRSSELGDFPGPVGEKVDDEQIVTIGSFSEIFTFTPGITYVDNKIKIDIELSFAYFNGDPTGHDLDTAPIVFYLGKGLTFADLQAHRDVQCHVDGRQGGTNGSGASLNSVSACTIDSTQPSSVSRFNTGFLQNKVFATPGDITFYQGQYSFHGTVWFNPGEKLFLMIQPNMNGTTTGQSAQFVIYSDTYTFRNSYQNGTGNPVFTLTKQVNAADASGGANQPISYIRLTFDSTVKESAAPAFLVNEALSRAAEIVTDDKFRVYSDYFGRTDAQPYASGSDGPGGLLALSTGLLIRGYSPLGAYYMGVASFNLSTVGNTVTTYALNLTDEPSTANNLVRVSNPAGTTVVVPLNSSVAYPVGFQVIVEQGSGVATIAAAAGVEIYSPSGKYHTGNVGEQMLLTKISEDSWMIACRASMYVSFKDILEALNAVYTAGYAIEDDPARTGYQRVRVEPIDHFYDSSTIMMTCENVDSVETDLDMGNMVNAIDIGYSKWEAEGAQGLDEFLTKRNYRTTLNSVRNKWDRLCKFIASGYAIETTRRKLGTNTTDWRYDNDNFLITLVRDSGFKSEQGGFLTDATHTPSGLIDPSSVYNARISPIRNLLRWLRWIMPSYPDPSAGQLIFTQGDGNYYASGKLATNPVETDSVTENQTLMLSDVAGSPAIIYKNEIITFKYPLGFNEWVNIYTTKYGLIKYNINNGPWRYGYLMNIKYDLYEGMAEFTLKTAVL